MSSINYLLTFLFYLCYFSILFVIAKAPYKKEWFCSKENIECGSLSILQGQISKTTEQKDIKSKITILMWQNGKHCIGGMGLRTLEDLAMSQVGLVPHSTHWFVFVTTQICICYIQDLYFICYCTDFYLLHHRFVFVTSQSCICYITHLYLLPHRFVFVTTLIHISHNTNL